MAVNRYNSPAQAQFMNTYAPLPFDQMYRVGAAMYEQTEKARKDLADFTEKYARFNSPSAIDTRNYYDKTLGRVRPVVEQAIANPDLIKTPEWRSMASNAIYNVDYAGLANLERSRIALEERRDNERKLALAGKWNPNWHGGFDYTGYDTLNNGIFQDTNLIPYQSITEGTWDTYESMKPSLLPKSNGTWEYVGIDEDMVNDVTRKNLNTYAATPEGRMHMIEAINTGQATPETALDWLAAQMNQAGQRKVHELRSLNPMLEMNMRYGWHYGNGGGRSGSGSGAGGSASDGDPNSFLENVRAEQASMLNRYLANNKQNVLLSYPTLIPELTAYGVSPVDIANISKSNSVDDAYRSISNLVYSGSIPQDVGTAIMGRITMNSMNDINNAILSNDQKVINDLAINVSDKEWLYNYYGFEPSDSFIFSNNKGEDGGLYKKIRPSFLQSGRPIDSNGRSFVDISKEAMTESKVSGGGAPFSDDAKKYKLNEAARKAFGEKPIMEYLLNNLNEAYISPSNEIRQIGWGDSTSGQNVTTANRVEVLMPKEKVDKILDAYKKENNLKMSNSILLDVINGKHSKNRSQVISEVTEKGRSLSTDKEPKYTKGEYYIMNMDIPLSNKMNADRADAISNKELFGVANAFKGRNATNMLNSYRTGNMDPNFNDTSINY